MTDTTDSTYPLSKHEGKLLLGQSMPVVVYATYIISVAALIVLAFVVDWKDCVDTLSAIVLVANAGVGFTFTFFFYFINPQFLCMAANFFSVCESYVVGRPFEMLTVEDSTKMFQVTFHIIFWVISILLLQFFFKIGAL